MKVVIFDMDGTLIDSALAIEKTINEMRKRVGLKPNLDTNFIIETINNPTKNYAVEFYGLTTITAELRNEFEAEFVKNYELHARLYDGVFDLLVNLKKECFIALASNAPSASLNDILEKNGVVELFDMVIGADKNTPQKPDPTMLLKVLDNVNKIKPVVSKCFVGDSAKDEEAAINAQIPYFQASWGFGKMSKSFPTVSTPKEAYELIKKLFYQN